MSNERARYSHAVKQQVRQRYPLCRTTSDKEALANELGIDSVAKLYNLASRLGATGKNEAEQLSLDKANESERLLIRQTPVETTWTPVAKEYLAAEFGRKTVEAIAFHLHHSETSVLYQARKLGLRLPVKHWNLVKVSAWLGFSEEELRELDVEGLDIYPLHDLSGHLTLEVISTTSLGRWMQIEKNLKKLNDAGADEFFILEIQESLKDLASGTTEWESCKFLSHGHVCMNPYTEVSFGVYCTNTDRQRAGEDPSCSARTLDIADLRPG